MRYPIIDKDGREIFVTESVISLPPSKSRIMASKQDLAAEAKKVQDRVNDAAKKMNLPLVDLLNRAMDALEREES